MHVCVYVHSCSCASREGFSAGFSDLQVEQEYLEPHSQPRLTGAKVQHMWSQSLYILCQLLQGNFINIGEVDPLNRRLSKTAKPDTLVQGT